MDSSLVAVLPSTYRTAETQIREALRLLDYRPRRDKLLIKPNLVTAPLWLPLGGIPRAAVTDLRFIEALLRVFDGYDITIAEGAIPGYDTGAILQKNGIYALARKYGAQVVNLNRVERFAAPWAYGHLRLPALLQTHEYINVPKLKTHVLTGVTLGCKNQKGLLAGADKIRFHRELDLHTAIQALNDAVQPALTLVDGIVGLDRGGPTAGRTRHANLIIAGRDVRAVDVACCDLVSVPLEEVAHLARVPYRTVGAPLDKLHIPAFETSAETVIANLHIHAPAGTCSRCMQSMHEGAAAYWRSPRHILRGLWSCILHRTDLIMGQDKEIPHEASGRLICYGQCTQKLAERHNLLWIPGCPPSPAEHLKLY